MRNYFKEMLKASCILCVLSCTSCVNKIEDEATEVDIKESAIPISFNTKISKATTRTSDAAFEKGEKVGLFAMLAPTPISEQRYINNLCLTCGDGKMLIPEKEVFYPEGDNALDFISYYPYKKEGCAKESLLLPISVQTDQSTSQERSVSDFLLAKATGIKSGNEPVELLYKHQLVKIKIILSPKEGESADDILKANPKIIATGFHTQAEYDLQSEKIISLSAKADILPYGTWKKQNNNTLQGKEFVIIPQENKDKEQAFILEWNGKLYTCPMPSVAIKGNTEFEIRIDALQATDRTLSGIANNIKTWENQENGESENDHNLTSIRIAALSFSTSDVYRVYYQSMPIAEICKEYLCSTDNSIASRAIVVYPVQDEKTNLQDGTVLQLLDQTGMVHGGHVEWDLQTNALTYTPGTSNPIESFNIGANGKISLKETENSVITNVSSYRIRDLRDGTLQTYPIVKIGTQYWMKEDLQATSYNDGTKIQLEKALKIGDYYYKWNDYGIYLYNGEAVLKNKLAPNKWKIPTEEDWILLKNYVNGKASVLKQPSAWNVEIDSTPATDESGLNISPNGFFMEYNGKQTLMNRNTSVAFWAYDNTKAELSKVFMLAYKSNELEFRESVKAKDKDYYNAFSIRCIKE